MGEEFWEWVTRNLWAGWGVLAAGLAALELLTLDFTLLMLAIGAAAGGATALIFPGMWWLQVIVAIVASFMSLAILRPTLLEKIRNEPGYRSSTDSLLGTNGVATTQITGTTGEVKVDGQLWAARSFDPTVRILEGQDIEIYDRDGVTLLVYPVDPAREITGYEN